MREEGKGSEGEEKSGRKCGRKGKRGGKRSQGEREVWEEEKSGRKEVR